VRVIARAREVYKAEPGWKRADGEPVSFCPVPHFIGLSETRSNDDLLLESRSGAPRFAQGPVRDGAHRTNREHGEE